MEKVTGRVSDILKTTHFDSSQDLAATLKRYLRLYNHHIPQKALGHTTPVQALKEWEKKKQKLCTKKVYEHARPDIWVDGGYRGQLVKWVAARFRFVLEVVLRPKETRKFVLLLRRWVVERTFGWLNHSRRLSKCYERQTRTDEIWMYIAMTRIMLARLA